MNSENLIRENQQLRIFIAENYLHSRLSVKFKMQKS